MAAKTRKSRKTILPLLRCKSAESFIPIKISPRIPTDFMASEFFNRAALGKGLQQKQTKTTKNRYAASGLCFLRLLLLNESVPSVICGQLRIRVRLAARRQSVARFLPGGGVESADGAG
jgi:hypothetical protein